MDKQVLDGLLQSEQYQPVFDIIKNYAKNPWEYLKQYNPKTHKIHDPVLRPNRVKSKPTGTLKANGEPEVREYVVPVARIALPLQKKIVKSAAGILCGNPIELDFTGKDTRFDELKKIWDANKLDYKSKRLAVLMMAETECAELWYQAVDAAGASTGEHRMMVLAPSYGDTLYPVFDNAGNMIAFGRSYEGSVWNETSGTKQDNVTFLEFYDKANVWTGNNSSGELLLDQKQHGYDKIPIVYYSQEYPEWYDVQDSIERVETIISNLADTNDYFGSPTAVATGNILGYADKGESGKMVQLENGAKMEYLTWDAVPEAIKLELEGHLKNIFGLTDTIRLSPDDLKGLFGSAPSGYAIKLMFTDAHRKASEHEENFGESIQRRINLLKSFVKAEDLDIKPKFTYFLPKNDAEDITNINNAVLGGILSTETGVKQNPLVQDADAELELIKNEKQAKQDAQVKVSSSAGGLDGLMNVA